MMMMEIEQVEIEDREDKSKNIKKTKIIHFYNYSPTSTPYLILNKSHIYTYIYIYF